MNKRAAYKRGYRAGLSGSRFVLNPWLWTMYPWAYTLKIPEKEFAVAWSQGYRNAELKLRGASTAVQGK
jgi:hypothetical protein